MSFISEMKWALTMSLKMKQRPFFVITYTIAMLQDRRRNKAAKETEKRFNWSRGLPYGSDGQERFEFK